MNPAQVRHVVMRYLEATACHILEASPAHVVAKLSPEADKELTNRSYYWGFIERTGVEPETMTLSFVFDPEKLQQLNASTNGSSTPLLMSGMRPEQLTFGNARLQRIIQAVKSRGQYVHLYEEPPVSNSFTSEAIAYTSWLVVNYKLSYLCDLKRDELHSLGISLATGDIVLECHSLLQKKSLTPKLPAHTHLRETISLERAKSELDKYIEQLVETQDNAWAVEATERMQGEIERMDAYYNELLQRTEEEVKAAVEAQHRHRLAEIEWQYKPRIQATPVNCGIFHLLDDGFYLTT